MARAQRFRVSPSYRDAVLATNPVAYWRLGEASGTVARDEMGANDGTYVNTPTLGVAGLLAGDSDTAVGLAAASHQYASLPASFAFAGDYMLAAWVSTTDTAIRIILGRNVSGRYVYLGYESGSWHFQSVTPSALLAAADPTGTHFVVGLRSGSNVRIYVDGVLGGSVGVGAPEGTSDATMAIGRLAGETAYDWNGTIDEPAIWDRALTADEIAWLYRMGMGR